MTTIREAAEAGRDAIIALRRSIHAEPELGLHTPMTSAKVREALDDLPLEWREGTSTTGLVAVLKGAKPGKRVLLRGDMDALPMDEGTGVDFASTIPGRMHACGHDAHTAMLAGAVRLLAERESEIAGEILFMFQPGEEGHHGARFMLEDGLIDPLPDAAFALHVMPNAPFGVFGGRAGALLASADQVEITIKGQGGHASMPHDTRDPIPAACAVVPALQTMVTRRFTAADAVVLTITQLQAGSAHNVIADNAVLKGTMRSLSREHREKLHRLVPQVVAGIAAAHGVEAETKIIEGFPVTVCDERAVDLGARVAADLFDADAWRTLPAPIMGAEDFSYVLEKAPGAMFFLGVAPEGSDWSSCCAIHSPRMMIDEAALPRGSAMLAACATRFLEKGFG